MLRAIVMIDGGHLRVLAHRAKFAYTADLVEKVAHQTINPKEEKLLRILYYDCAPYSGTVKLPVSGNDKVFIGDNSFLKSLGAKDLFAVRHGVLKFRGFKPRKVPVAPATLTDADFKPDFEQKGVDMRIGLDIATYSNVKAADRIILITADTDCIPAMKHGRKEGLQIVLIRLPNGHLAQELTWHTDYVRPVFWP